MSEAVTETAVMKASGRASFSQWSASSPSRAKTFQAGKPKFLSDLEAYLEKELAICGDANDRRLQIFGEVFDRFIEDFSTYKPFLSSIRSEYERQVSALKTELGQLRQLPAQSALAAREYELQRAAMEQDRRLEQRKLLDASTNARRRIMELEETIAQHVASNESLTRELEKSTRQLHEEIMARKLLLAQISSGSNAVSIRDDDEVAALKEQLEAMRGEVEAMRVRTEQAGAARLAESQRREQKLQRDVEAVQNDLTGLMSEHSALSSLCREALSSKSHATQKIDALQRELTTLRASVPQALDPAVFPPLGVRLTVPVHLRTSVPVRDRQLSVADVRVLALDLLRDRTASIAASGVPAESFSAFVADRLRRNFSEETALEWAYNIHFACERSPSEPDLNLVYSVLSGKCQEELLSEAAIMEERVLSALDRLHLNPPSQPLTSKDIVACVRIVCPFASSAPLLQIADRFAPQQTPPSMLRDANSAPSDFLRELLLQLITHNKMAADAVADRASALNRPELSAFELAGLVASTLEGPSALAVLLWVFDPSLVAAADRADLLDALRAGSRTRLETFTQPSTTCIERLRKACLIRF